MQKPRRPSKRQLNVFPETKDHSERRNPKSIRKLIYDVIRSDFEGDCNKAALKFEEVRKAHKNRNYKTSVTAESYYRIVHDKQSARYMHLEAIAIYLKVPVGLLLLYSRLTAEQNEDNEPRLRVMGMLDALALIVQHAKEKAQKAEQINELFRYYDLKLWIDYFKDRPRPGAGTSVIKQSA